MQSNWQHADLLRKQNELQISTFARHFSTFLKFFSLFVVYAAESVPTVSFLELSFNQLIEINLKSTNSLQALTLYWCSSFVVGLTQNILFSSPTFRRWCNIPRTVRELKPVQWKLDLLLKK